ncbi:hypothetical protein GCM10009734_65950 [Nonomuraea bangladeshensis]
MLGPGDDAAGAEVALKAAHLRDGDGGGGVGVLPGPSAYPQETSRRLWQNQTCEALHSREIGFISELPH